MLTLTIASYNVHGGTLAGGLSLVKSGPGVLLLCGSNTYTGYTRISEGVLRVSGSGAVSDASPVILANTAGAALELLSSTETIGSLTGGGSAGGNVLLGASGVLVVGGDNTSPPAFAGNISGTGPAAGLVKLGSGILTLTGQSSYAGATHIQAGSIVVGGGNDRLPAASTLILGQGTSSGLLDLNGTDQTFAGLATSGTGTQNIINNSAARTSLLTINSSADTTFAGSLKGNLSLTKAGTAKLQLASASTYTGVTKLEQGILQLGADNVLPDTALIIAPAIASATATLDLNNFSDRIGVLTLGGAANAVATITTGTGTIILGGDVTYVSTGSPKGAVISGKASLAGATRTFTVGNGPDAVDLDLRAAVTNGKLVKAGTGVLRLGGDNTFATGLVLQAGTTTLATDSAAGTGAITLTGGTLSTEGGNRTVANTVDVSGTATISLPAQLRMTGALTVPGNLTKTGSGTLLCDLPATVTGVITLSAGTLDASLNVSPTGQFKQTGGAYQGTLSNSGTFTYSAGTFHGRLVNNGTASLSADLLAEGGIVNGSTIQIATGRTVQAGDPGFSNQGTLTLAGGTIGGSGPIVNDALISGNGFIAGSGGFTNRAQVSVSGASLTLSNTGALVNDGNLDLQPGLQLRLVGSNLANSGTLSLGRGAVAGTAALTNLAGGTIVGPGTISTDLSNTGNLVVPPGTVNLAAGFSNPGLVQLTGPGATLTGSAFANTGVVEGAGSISNQIANKPGGSIEASGGTLLLGSALTNEPGALLSVPAGAKLIAPVFPASAGTISMAGGTFDTQGQALANTGLITGFGTLRSGILTNDGSMVLTGGLNLVNSPLTNSPEQKVSIRHDPALFTSPVTNNGVFEIIDTTVTFAAGSTGVAAAAMGTVSVTGGGQVVVDSHSTLQSGAIRQDLLTLKGEVLLQPDSGTSRLLELDLAGGDAPTALLDLSDTGLVVQPTGDVEGVLATLTAQIASARNSGTRPWSGRGITSSKAAKDDLWAVGVLLNTGGGVPIYEYFDDIEVNASSILIRCTLNGDLDLNERIDGDDYARMDWGFLGSLGGWGNGDVNYDGRTSAEDYFLMDAAFLTHAQGGDLGGQSTAVPEPGIALSLAAVVGALAGRRGRRPA